MNRDSSDTAEEFDRRTVAAAWRTYVDEGRVSGSAVRAVIGESWQRSRALGVEAHGIAAPLVGDDVLAARRESNRALLDAAEHTWRLLSDSLGASDNVFVVTDAEGVILEVRGNEEFVTAAARQGCGPGRDWSEAASGTNAIGTALAVSAPVSVQSTEHFVEAAKVWDCAAAPIHDLDDGTVLGTLCITSVGDLSDHHSLALAVTAANQIEHALHSRELAQSVQLLNWHRTAIGGWRDKASLLLDRRGRVLRATAAAETWAASCSEPFAVVDARPQPPAGSGLRVTDTRPYRAPAADGSSGPGAGHGASRGEWQGGIVRVTIEDRGGPSPSATRAAAAVPAAFENIVTADAGLVELMHRAARMARAASPILLHGETGTGKELFASAIHASSGVAGGPFVAVNCGTLTRELAASELLGYEPGAFTGAQAGGRAGKFEQADGGTLFLDEIGELPLDVQVHLLRVLQDGMVVRVGGNQARSVAVRVIAATHRDLEHEAECGRFRSDLLFRLRVLALELPPLRARSGDIPALVTRYLQQLQARYGLGAKQVSDTLMARLLAHAWPGNVRELHGVVENLYILSDRRELTPADLPPDFAAAAVAPAAAPETTAEPPAGGLERLERDAILAAIEDQRHNMAAVARSLGISRSTLYRKLRRFGISRDGVPG